MQINNNSSRGQPSERPGVGQDDMAPNRLVAGIRNAAALVRLQLRLRLSTEVSLRMRMRPLLLLLLMLLLLLLLLFTWLSNSQQSIHRPPKWPATTSAI